MCEKEKYLFDFLKRNEIKFNIYEHEPVYTVEDVKNAKLNIPGVPTKNLFLKSKDKKKYYLFIMQEDKKADLKEITFASKDELKQILNLEFGDVGPFGIIYDKENIVQILIDSELKDKKDINFSANSLSTTVTIDYDDLIKFIEKNGNKYEIVNIEKK